MPMAFCCTFPTWYGMMQLQAGPADYSGALNYIHLREQIHPAAVQPQQNRRDVPWMHKVCETGWHLEPLQKTSFNQSGGFFLSAVT